MRKLLALAAALAFAPFVFARVEPPPASPGAIGGSKKAGAPEAWRDGARQMLEEWRRKANG